MSAPASIGQTPRSTGLLLDLPVPFRQLDGQLSVESQAHNGLQRWLEHFDAVTVCAPLIPEDLIDHTLQWQALNDLTAPGRLRVEVLPWGYHPGVHFAKVNGVRRRLRELIATHQYLCFSNLGWLGSWGNIGAEEAQRAGRPYAVWLDWVLHEMPRPQRSNPLRAAFDRFSQARLKHHSLRAIRHARLGLFHGRSVYEAYAPMSRAPHIVHDVHLKPNDLITEQRLSQRLNRNTGPGHPPLRIGYVGRVHPMKGPMAWIETLEHLLRQDFGDATHAVPVEAIWLGEGPLLDTARLTIQQQGMTANVTFAGLERDRARVLEFFRSLDLFMFCHLTPESPRCLMEALMSGVPLVGFESAYASDLVAEHGGGTFVKPLDTRALAHELAQLLTLPELRRSQTRAARRSGEAFSDEAVFRHRSELIRNHLRPDAETSIGIPSRERKGLPYVTESVPEIGKRPKR